MKSILLAAALLAVGTGVAGATDLPSRTAPPPPPAPEAPASGSGDWAGFYAGAHAGYGFETARKLNPANAGVKSQYEAFMAGLPYGAFARTKDQGEGFLGGVHAGYAIQSDRFVYGVEGDVTFLSGKSSKTLSNAYSTPFFLANFDAAYAGRAEFEADWLATARVRAGYAFGDVLPYATFGAALSRGTVRVAEAYGATLSSPFGTVGFGASGAGSDGRTLLGYAVGGGVEYALSPSIRLRGEYLFADFGKRTFLTPVPSKIDLNVHQFRIGASYRF